MPETPATLERTGFGTLRLFGDPSIERGLEALTRCGCLSSKEPQSHKGNDSALPATCSVLAARRFFLEVRRAYRVQVITRNGCLPSQEPQSLNRTNSAPPAASEMATNSARAPLGVGSARVSSRG